MSKTKPTYQELEKRLAVAEPIVKALKNHEVDAVVGEEKIAFLLLSEVEEALRISDAGFRAMFELSGIGMIQADAPGFRFTRVNQKFCEITGYSAEELLTKTYLGLTHPEDRPRDMTELARVLRGKADSWSIEKRCVRKDGSLIWVGVHGAVLRDDTGRAVSIMAMIGDLTASKPAEQEPCAAESPASKGKPQRLKKAAVKKARDHARSKRERSSAGTKASDKRPLQAHRRKLGKRQVPMKTSGEIEAAICQGMSRFVQDCMGRGPKDIHTHLIGDLLVVRLQGVLTAAEQHLVKSLQAEKGRDLLKQVRTQLMETARPIMEAMVKEITGIKVLSMHHDISTKTGEEVVLFTLAESPNLRSAKKQMSIRSPIAFALEPCRMIV